MSDNLFCGRRFGTSNLERGHLILQAKMCFWRVERTTDLPIMLGYSVRTLCSVSCFYRAFLNYLAKFYGARSKMDLAMAITGASTI